MMQSEAVLYTDKTGLHGQADDQPPAESYCEEFISLPVEESHSELSTSNTIQCEEENGYRLEQNQPTPQDFPADFGDTQNSESPLATIQKHHALAERLLQTVTTWKETPSGLSRLTRQLRAERDFLAKLLSGSQPISATYAASSNLSHLRALVLTIQALKTPCSVLKSFRLKRSVGTVGEESLKQQTLVCECQRAISCSLHSGREKAKELAERDGSSLSEEEVVEDVADDLLEETGCFEDGDKVLVVDIVADDGQVWLKVVARNPKSLQQSCQGDSAFGKRSLLVQCKALLLAANNHQHNFSPPTVCVVFARGVTEPVRDALLQMGVLVGGRILSTDDCQHAIPVEEAILEAVHVIPTSCHMNETRVNLDVTAMVVLVSELTHGSAHFDFHEEVLNRQASEERQNPALLPLQRFLEGKQLVACQTAVRDFQSILSAVAGPQEKERARLFLDTVTVVDDNMSARVQGLKTSARIRNRSKAVFGTGDHLKLVTVSANMSFVRAAQSQDITLSIFSHPARALSERKQAKATPLLPPS